ncbi:MAG: NAD-dependent epimerase/dehydratase [Caulobacteraceae bacterium]|nr:NAD-dependent epimerase/dehydratase [Caulobacteraceae bacterium]
MKIVITGGAGFLGQKLARRLLQLDGIAARDDGVRRPIDEVVLVDRVAAPDLGVARVRSVAADITDAQVMGGLIGPDVDLVFHLAAIVSGAAEADFDLGMAINLDASRRLLDLCRAAGHRPRVVFTSSVAVYGGALPPVVTDETRLDPRSSYGVQKAIGELLLGDYTRKGFVDGRILRLPTISVRPGAPNKAASSFASGLIREPLGGQPTVCPVSTDLRLWLLSPRGAIDGIVAGAQLPSSALGDQRALNLPGLSVSVAEMIAALERAGGRAAVDLIRFERDPAVEAIVGGWPAAWDISRAQALGLKGDPDFDAIVRAYVEDELN